MRALTMMLIAAAMMLLAMAGCNGLLGTATEVSPAQAVTSSREQTAPTSQSSQPTRLIVRPTAPCQPAAVAVASGGAGSSSAVAAAAAFTPPATQPAPTVLDFPGGRLQMAGPVALDLTFGGADSRYVVITDKLSHASSPGLKIGGKGDVDIGKLKPPSASLGDEPKATGGGLSGLSASWGVPMAGSSLGLYIVGGLLIVAGVVVAIWLKQVKLGLALAAGGGVLIAVGVTIEQYPWVWLVALGVAVGVAGWLLYSQWIAKRKADALAIAAAGVENASPDAAAAVKQSIAAAGGSEPWYKVLLTKVKAAIGSKVKTKT